MVEATIKRTENKINFSSLYFVDKVVEKKTIDDKFTVRLIKGNDRDGTSCVGVDVIFKNKYASAVVLFSNKKEEVVKGIYDKINDFDGVYRFVSLFQI